MQKQSALPDGYARLDFVDDRDISDRSGEFIENPQNNPESSPFLHSLETLSPDDLAPKPPKKKLTLYALFYGGARYLLLIISVGVFVWSMYAILDNLFGYRKAEDLYASLADDFNSDGFALALDGAANTSPTLPSSVATPDYKTSLALAGDPLLSGAAEVEATQYNQRFERKKSQLNSLSIKNPDVYGLISVANTVIDYPIMQSDDNEYYLDHAYTGDFLQAGSIFADYRCYDSIMKNFHVILYGHNMRNGLMFNNVMKYLDETFFDENPYIEVYTFDGIYKYEVFAIYETRYDYDYIRTGFENYDQFIEYCEKLRANSMYEREGIEFKEGDRLLTLSTCTNNVTETGRYALQAVLVGVEK